MRRIGIGLAAGIGVLSVAMMTYGQDAPVAVSGASFTLEGFGGGDEYGSAAGGGASATLPLGRLGLQVDGIAGYTANEKDYWGGAAQIYLRDPASHLIGLAASGFSVDGTAQYSVSAIGEYYIDKVTLEGVLGYQWGDIARGPVARAGFSYYAADDFRFGIGVGYGEDKDVAADAEVEYLALPQTGLALYASGAFDNAGSLGLVGLRLYLGGGDGATSLLARHRQSGRPNFLLAAPAITGARIIGRTAGALNAGTALGDMPAVAAPAARDMAGDAVSGLWATFSRPIRTRRLWEACWAASCRLAVPARPSIPFRWWAISWVAWWKFCLPRRSGSATCRPGRVRSPGFRWRAIFSACCRPRVRLSCWAA